MAVYRTQLVSKECLNTTFPKICLAICFQSAGITIENLLIDINKPVLSYNRSL